MKRFLSIFVAIVMTMTMVVPAFAYTDTDDSDYNAPITHLSGLGVINGYEDGSFQPEKVVTRAEMAKLLVVALGLEAGASLLEGTSSFDDVPTTHWATGYIAVAVQYGLIKGDGDGNFRPDDTVNYAEVATMALRALGYDRVVDKNGQWPTNYLNKANELKIFDDIVESFVGTDGATRGTVAQMLWNMLNTKMWEVTSENENDGLNYSKGETMLKVKFPEYTFADELIFEEYEVAENKGKWEVTLAFEDDTDTYKYAGNDFYTFVPGTEFEALIYTAKKSVPEIISMFATEDNYLAEGNVWDLEDKYSEYTATADATYAYLLLDSAKKSANVEAAVEISGVDETAVITDVQETKAATKVYVGDTIAFRVTDDGDEYELPMIIKDGQRGTVLDLEIGDIVTYVDDNVLVVSDKAVKGTYDSISINETLNDYEIFIEVNGKEYDARTAYDAMPIFIAEDDTEEELTEEEYEEFYTEKAKNNKFIDQTATFYFNAFNDLVKVVFGNVDDIENTGSFYLITTGKVWSVADSEGAVDYIQLANEDGVKSYVINEDIATVDFNKLNDQAGSIVWVEFDKNDEIEEVLTIEDEAEITDEYVIAKATEALNKDTAYVGDIKITSNTVVFTYTEILDEDDLGTGKYKLELSKGSKALEGVAAEDILLALEDETSVRASYAFVAGDPVSSDKNYGILEGYTSRLGVEYVTISGVKYELDSTSEEGEMGDAVIFTVNDNEAKITFVYAAEEIANAAKVTNVDGEIVELNDGEIIFDLDLLPTEEYAVTTAPDGALKEISFEDYKVFTVEVEYDRFDDPNFTNLEEVAIDAVKVAKNNGIAINVDQEVIVIIKGIDWDL